MRFDLSHGYVIDLPDSWNVARDPDAGAELIGAVDISLAGFVPNIVVSFSALDAVADASIELWQKQSVAQLNEHLHDLLLIDYMLQEDAFRQVLTYVLDNRSLTLEQWVTRDTEAGVGVTVSATVPTLNYLDFVEQMTAIAWSLEKGSDE